MGIQSAGETYFILVYFLKYLNCIPKYNKPDLREVHIVSIILVEKVDWVGVNQTFMIEYLILAKNSPTIKYRFYN